MHSAIGGKIFGGRFSGRRSGLAKRFVWPAALMVVVGFLVGAMDQGSATDQPNMPATVYPESTGLPKAKSGDKKQIDFVLAEVRKQLEPNPETEIVDLTIDPDYKGAADTYLVNVVLDAHGRKLTLGVMVTVQQNAKGPQALLGFID
jgi:hypothetical protein